MLNNLGGSGSSIVEGVPGQPLNRYAIPRLSALLASQTLERLLPIFLGAGYGLAATLLVIVELAQPPQQSGFQGIRFSNAVNSDGTRAIVALFRDRLTWLPFPEPLSPGAYVAGLVAAWASMIALQIAAILICRRTGATSPAIWAVGPVIASFVLLAYPPTSTDIYAYSSFGWVAEEGENPYLRAPDSLAGDPYGAFNDWTHIRTPYGPIWTGVSRAVVHFAHEEPFATALGFKIIAGLAAFGLAAVTYRLALRYTQDRHLAVMAFVLVCWSPILITESVATVHLDSVMMLLAMLGLLAATGARARTDRLGLALTVASALVKPVTLPLAALMVLARLSKPERIALIARRVALDLLLVVAIVLAAFAPFWDRSLPESLFENARALYLDHPLRSNPLWIWAFAHIDSVVGIGDRVDGDAGAAMRWSAISLAAGFAMVLTPAMFRQRRRFMVERAAASDPVASRFLLVSWAAVTAVVGMLPVNAHPWYAIWSMAPLAILWVSDGRRNRRNPPGWLLAVHAWALLSFLVYHTLPIR